MNQAAFINLALLALFGIQHSIMARKWFKEKCKLPKPRRTYALATVAILILIARFWQPMPELAWRFQGAVAIGLYIVWTLGLQLILFGAMSINARELLGLAEPGPPEFHTPFLYTIVRHPIYLALMLVGLGSFLWIPTYAVGLGAIMLALVGDLRGRVEEKLLLGSFGDDYRDYMRRTRRFVPGIY